MAEALQSGAQRLPKRRLSCRARAVFLVLLGQSACNALESITVLWPDSEAALAFAYSRDGDGTIAEIDPSGFEVGVPDTPLNIQLSAGKSLILVVVDPKLLDAQFPALEGTLPEDLRLELAPSTCPEGETTADLSRISVALERPAMRVLAIDRDGKVDDLAPGAIPALDSLTLSGPTKESFCAFAESRKLTPFGSSLELIPDDPSDGVRQLDFAARLGDDRLIAGASGVLYLLERGRGVESTPSHMLTALEAGLPYGFEDIAVNPTDPSEVLLVATRQNPPAGALLRLRLDAQGFVGTETATTVGGTLRSIIFGDRGEVVAIGDNGLILASPGIDGPFSSPVPPRPVDLFAVTTTKDPRRPHAITTRDGHFWLGNALAPGAGAFSEEAVGIVASLTSVVVRQREGVDEPDAWVGTEDGVLLTRRGEGDWARISYGSRDLAGGCAEPRSGECGTRLAADRLEHARLLQSSSMDRLFFTVRGCTGVLTFAPGSPCAEYLSIEGDTLELLKEHALYGLVLSGGYLTAVGQNGRVAELRLEQAPTP